MRNKDKTQTPFPLLPIFPSSASLLRSQLHLHSRAVQRDWEQRVVVSPKQSPAPEWALSQPVVLQDKTAPGWLLHRPQLPPEEPAAARAPHGPLFSPGNACCSMVSSSARNPCSGVWSPPSPRSPLTLVLQGCFSHFFPHSRCPLLNTFPTRCHPAG